MICALKPEDIAIVGNCESYEANYVNPSLSSIDILTDKACAIVTDEIINVVRGKTKKYSATLCAVFNKRKSSDISTSDQY